MSDMIDYTKGVIKEYVQKLDRVLKQYQSLEIWIEEEFKSFGSWTVVGRKRLIETHLAQETIVRLLRELDKYGDTFTKSELLEAISDSSYYVEGYSDPERLEDLLAGMGWGQRLRLEEALGV